MSQITNTDEKFNSMNLIELINSYYKTNKPTHGKAFFNAIRFLKNTINDIQTNFNTTIMPQQVNDEFMNYYIKYLYDNKKYSYSTVELLTDHIKSVIDFGISHGIQMSDHHRNVTCKHHHKQHYFLKEDDLIKLWSFPFDKVKSVHTLRIKSLILTRDTFLLQCGLGLRYSDLERISPENFYRHIFKTKTKKYGTDVTVNIDHLAFNPTIIYEILDKYEHTIPYKSEISNYNKNLKDLFKLCGFDAILQLEEVIGNKTLYNTDAEYNLITSHTARRTFATLNHRKHIDSKELINATGHHELQELCKYIQEDAKIIQERSRNDVAFNSLTNGIYNKTAEEKRARNRAYRQKNIEHIRERSRQYRELHKDEINAARRKQRAVNGDVIREKQRNYYKKHKDEINEKRRNKNKEMINKC